jgi:hypothetical protein
MGKLAIGVLAFAAGAAAGGLFVKWYVETHTAELGLKGVGEKFFGEGSTGAQILAGIGHTFDEVRA